MRKIIIVITLIILIFPLFSGCILFGQDEGDNDTGEGFTEEELTYPSFTNLDKYKRVFQKPSEINISKKVPFKYETEWAFAYNTVYTKLGGVLQLWLTNLGETQIYIYEFGIAPEWLDYNLTEPTGKILKPDEEVEVGYVSFPGPDLAGNYSYELRFGFLARNNDTSDWFDWGLTGNKTYEMDVQEIGADYLAKEYKTEHNPKSLYDQINDLIDPLDPDVRNTAVDLVKKYEGNYNVFQMCEIFEHVKNNISYVNDPRTDENYWSTPKETLKLCAGDCEDSAALFAALISSISGTVRLYMTDSHAFPVVFIGDTESVRDGILTAIDSYYVTELNYAWIEDELGYWLIADSLGSIHLGGFPLGAEPLLTGGTENHGVTGSYDGKYSWDFVRTENLYIVDIK